MTMPSERTRAVLETEKFLKTLLALSAEEITPEQLKATARFLLRHYPTAADIELMVSAWGTQMTNVIDCPFAAPPK